MISVVGSVVVDSLLPPFVMCVWGRGSGVCLVLRLLSIMLVQKVFVVLKKC